MAVRIAVPDKSNVAVSVDGSSRRISVQLPVHNRSKLDWPAHGPVLLGWQLFDPETDLFVAEGEWQPLPQAIPAGTSAEIPMSLQLPSAPGRYRVYLSPLCPESGWEYRRGERFVVLDVEVTQRTTEVRHASVTTLGRLRRSRLYSEWTRLFTAPFTIVWRHRSLVRAMVKREILVRYRGSAGDFIWTFLNPLLLMATYFFVFGVVMHTRFGADNSRSGFVLYFLAGMLPWLAFSEAVGRAPAVVIQNGNLVKKLVFPVETLPVNLVAAGLITQGIGTALFLIGLAVARGSLPASLVWTPVVFVPQVLLTLGICWLLAGFGVFFRDLGQIIGFVLTALFFLTPICYPDTNLPPAVATLLTRNPIYIIVRGYRMIMLEGQAPYAPMIVKLWAVSIVIFLTGYLVFHKLRRSFADVL